MMAKPHNGGAGTATNGPRERPGPSLRDQAAAHRASKGDRATRSFNALSRVQERRAGYLRENFAAQPFGPEYQQSNRRLSRLTKAARNLGRIT